MTRLLHLHRLRHRDSDNKNRFSLVVLFCFFFLCRISRLRWQLSSGLLNNKHRTFVRVSDVFSSFYLFCFFFFWIYRLHFSYAFVGGIQFRRIVNQQRRGFAAKKREQKLDFAICVNLAVFRGIYRWEWICVLMTGAFSIETPQPTGSKCVIKNRIKNIERNNGSGIFEDRNTRKNIECKRRAVNGNYWWRILFIYCADTPNKWWNCHHPNCDCILISTNCDVRNRIANRFSKLIFIAYLY